MLLELVPEGFEEVERDGRLELVAYVEEAEEPRFRSVFPDATSTTVPADWSERWRSFHTSAVAGGVWIGPPWEEPPPDQPVVVIDPGRAFGTGAHPTTRLCVELLARCRRGSLLDVGCGSGVLSLAAARLGFEPVIAVDLDPAAVETTRANALANGLTLDVRQLDGLVDEPPVTELVVANLLLEPVRLLLPRLPARQAVASGYLAGDEVSAPGWRRRERLELDGWAADLLERA